MSNSEVKGLILMGGQSSRMGTDKAFVEWKGKTLLQHAIDRLQEVTPNIYLSVNHQQYERLKDAHQCIPDKYINKGPLGGILSALESLQRDVLVVAVDMPNVTTEMLQGLLNKEKPTNHILAYKSEPKNLWQPLPSFWPKESISYISTTLSQQSVPNKRKGISLKSILDVYGEPLAVSYLEKSVKNVNEPDDLS